MAERHLPGDAGQPARAGLELRELAQQVRQTGGHVLPAAGEEGGTIPQDPHQGSGDAEDGAGAGRAQQEVVVLPVGGGQLLVEGADGPAGQQVLPPVDGGGGVQGRHPVPQQVLELGAGGGEHPMVPSVAAQQHRAGHGRGLRVLAPQPHLRVELAGQPLVVIVAEPDQLPGAQLRPGVASAGQPLAVLVGDGAQGAPGGHRHVLEGVDGDVVVGDDHLDLARVVLGEQGAHGPAQQLRTSDGGDHRGDAGQGAHEGSPGVFRDWYLRRMDTATVRTVAASSRP